jgi:hypothetical protein
MFRSKALLALCLTITGSVALAQIPDTASSVETGTGADGAGGAFNVTNADTASGFWNPAGLGYVGTRRVGITYRRAPSSRTRITGTYTSPIRATTPDEGAAEIAHVGVTIPVSEIRPSAKGTIGISYTRAGGFDDVGVGPNPGLQDTGGMISSYVERRKLKVDALTIAYGTTDGPQNLAAGVGIVLANAKVAYSESGNPVPGSWAPTSLSSTGTGVGVIAGVQYVPPKAQNMSIGLSYRSEIKLRGNESTAHLYDKVPARLVLGAAIRKDGLRKGQDFLVYGAQLERYSAGTRSLKFDRRAQNAFGLGVEYHYSLPSGEVPIRLGYRSVESGGVDFGGRNAITYGIGYLPRDRAYSLDLSFASSGGRTTFALSASFRFR